MFIKSKSLVPVFLALVQLATLAVAVKPPSAPTSTTTPSRYAHRLGHSGPPKVNTTAAHAPISPRQVHNSDYGSNNGPSGNPNSDSTSNSTSTDTESNPGPSAAAQRRRMLYGHISDTEGDNADEDFWKREPVTPPTRHTHKPPSSPIDVQSSENPQPKDVTNSITGRGWESDIEGEQQTQEFDKRAKHRHQQHQHQQSTPANGIPVVPKPQVQDKINGRALPADLLASTPSQQ
ncbi:hypothetical protein BD410DRAFT_784104 [Rickenella mellea]|uniref:Uncharacterized protein n=1 Tax=Rickenella mellea TaxID=50990 RepID=A0A4Y7QFP8_9AGAM|nr:hypothetical protein BD410DRAFT_784104 [Rickenella mellea]